MVIYTELTAQEISAFAKQFDLGIVHNFSPLRGGSTNSSYLLMTEKGKYILTICDDKTIEQIQMLMQLLKHLEFHGFHTSHVIKSHVGTYLLEFDNKPVYLKSYFEGRVPKGLSLTSLVNLGKTIAKLHEIPVFEAVPDEFPYGLNHFNEVISSSYQHPYVDWLKRMAKYLATHITNGLPRGLVHGDIFLDNLVETNNEQIIILDFEEASHFPFIFDIGMALAGSCLDNHKISLAKAKSLISGYLQVRALTQDERRHVKLFAVYAATATSFWRFRQYHLRIPTPKKFDKHQQMVDIAESLLQMDNSAFMRQVGLD